MGRQTLGQPARVAQQRFLLCIDAGEHVERLGAEIRNRIQPPFAPQIGRMRHKVRIGRSRRGQTLKRIGDTGKERGQFCDRQSRVLDA